MCKTLLSTLFEFNSYNNLMSRYCYQLHLQMKLKNLEKLNNLPKAIQLASKKAMICIETV